MRSRTALCTVMFASVMSIGVPVLVRADTYDDIIGQTIVVEQGADVHAGNINTVVARIINGALTLIGVIFVALMVYAGFLWMTAAGNADQVEKAQTTLRNAAIGVVLVFIAYGIAQFVIQALEKATK